MDETNLLSLVRPWLNTNYQITIKFTTVLFAKYFASKPAHEWTTPSSDRPEELMNRATNGTFGRHVNLGTASTLGWASDRVGLSVPEKARRAARRRPQTLGYDGTIGTGNLRLRSTISPRFDAPDCSYYILPPSNKTSNYGKRASQTDSSLTKFIVNSINIYVSKYIY
jgi:hypothetical protein